MSKRNLLALVAVTAIALFGAWSVTQRRANPLRVETHPRAVLKELGIASSARPQLTVSTAGVLYMLAGYEDHGRHRLVLTMSHDGGDTFSAPIPISEAEADVASHGENGPSLAQRGMAVYALWQQRTGDGAQQVMFARSLRMGHFDHPIAVTTKQQASFNGFSSLAVAPNGEIYAVWLDGRDKGLPGTFSVYMSRSTDKGASFSPDVRVAQGACPCCRPAVAVDESGEVYVAWRKVWEGDVRDVVVAASRDHAQTFSEPVTVGGEQWVLHACPEAGPALALANHKLFVAWFTEAGDTPEIRLAASADKGRSFGAAVNASAKVLDPNHPVLSASEDGSLVLAFQGRSPASDQDWSAIQPFLALVSNDGSVSQPVAVPISARSASYPAVAAMSARRAFVAWTQRGDDRTEVALSRARAR